MKRKYQVKPGCFYGPNNKHAAGEIVELEEAHAQGHLDILELVEDEPTTKTETKKAETKKAESEKKS